MRLPQKGAKMTTVLEQVPVASDETAQLSENDFAVVNEGLNTANQFVLKLFNESVKSAIDRGERLSIEEAKWLNDFTDAICEAGTHVETLRTYFSAGEAAWKRNDIQEAFNHMKKFLAFTKEKEKNIFFPDDVFTKILILSGDSTHYEFTPVERAPFMCDKIQQCLELLNQPVAKPDTDTQTPATPPQKAEPPTQKPVASQTSQKKDWKQQALEWWNATVKWFREFTQAMTSPSQRKIIDAHNERLRAPAQQTAQSDAVAQPIKREEVAR